MASSICSRLRPPQRSSDPSKPRAGDWGPQYLDYDILRLFSIDIPNLIRVKAMMLRQFRLAPSELDQMPYWEYEFFMKEINEIARNENENQEREMSKYDIQGTMKVGRNPSKMMPTTPTIPKINIPSSIKF